MEHAKDIIIKLFESPVLYIISIAVILFLLKKGLLSIDSSVVKLGRTRDNERRIIAAQMQYVTLHLDAIAMKMVKEMKDITPMHIKYVICRIQDEFVRRIVVNHISADNTYVNEVYLTIVDITRKRAAADYFWSADFEEFARKEVEEIIIALLNIRNRMSR